MVYKVTEVFYSIQGEGMDVGMPAVFIRLSGCSVGCLFCDTDHSHKFSANERELTAMVTQMVEPNRHQLVVITGGEPLEQNCQPLYEILQGLGYLVTFETNGTIPLPAWASSNRFNVSPKPGWLMPEGVVRSVKLLYPWQRGVRPREAQQIKALWYGIQPIDGVPNSTEQAAAYVKALGSPWRLSLQTHKLAGVQ